MKNLVELTITHWKRGGGAEILFIALMVFVLGSSLIESLFVFLSGHTDLISAISALAINALNISAFLLMLWLVIVLIWKMI